MANKDYSYAVGRRKEASATIKLSSKGSGNFLVKTAWGLEKTLQQYFGGNLYMYQAAISPLETIWNDAVKKFDAEISRSCWCHQTCIRKSIDRSKSWL